MNRNTRERKGNMGREGGSTIVEHIDTCVTFAIDRICERNRVCRRLRMSLT